MNLEELSKLDESRVTVDGDGHTVLPLAYPIKDGVVEVNELVLRRVKARDLEWAEANSKGSNASRRLIARLLTNGVSEQALEELDGYDFTQASALITSFFAKPHPTGATS